MKIIQIATLISPSGAYGGPVRVAVNQTRALLDAGHDVVLAAGASGFGRKLPKYYDGVPVALFEAFRPIPKSGFSGLLAPGLQTWLKGEMSSADVAHVHLGRDLITLPASTRIRRSRLPYVVQTHGMITASDHPLARPVDALWTKRALEGAGRVFYLTPRERLDLAKVTPAKLKMQSLHNGVPQPSSLHSSETSGIVEVLFLARLHSRKRPNMFIAMAKALRSKYPHVRFSLVGPDEGEGPGVTAEISSANMGECLTWEGAIPPEETIARINKATIYVLPSIHEPFPMSVLEALSLGKPVVVTNSCGLAPDIMRHNAGVVVEPTLESLIKGVERLLANPELRNSISTKAKELASEHFGMNAVCRQLEIAYEDIASDS